VSHNPVFSQLDVTGEFHRDSPLGRIFHPGTDSYREISPTDSLHIAVTPDNHVSVHVDRVSPLADGPAGRSRYSFVRVVHHNVAHGIDACARLFRRDGNNRRCELDCEIVTVQDESALEAPVMYEFSCRAAGAQGCRWKTRTTSEEELLARVTEHTRTVHGVSAVNGTLTNYARLVARMPRPAG
jgi:predicted small metal-binding protein